MMGDDEECRINELLHAVFSRRYCLRLSVRVVVRRGRDHNPLPKDWQLAIPDAPAIEISIDINGQKLKMTSCHTTLERSGNYLVTERGGQVVPAEDRASVLAKQSETFRRHRIAFEKILSLTLERTHARLSP
ncbi:MAG: hypothetical protein HYV99_02760 [Betaproteobacteria bacterium]|nr:hypothetical protein [Betaproteobacteria bacterium]